MQVCILAWDEICTGPLENVLYLQSNWNIVTECLALSMGVCSQKSFHCVDIQLPIIAVNMITTRILMSVESQSSFSNKLDQLRKSTVQDDQLTRLRGYINTGFPCDKKNLLTDLHEFWPHKEMLSVESGLITCGNRIIVPREMQPEMLQ